MGGNPIFLRELVQAAHRRRTYWIRAGVAAGAVVLLLPQVLSVLAQYGQDWRALAELGRPLFETSVWLQFIIFPLLAFGLATATVHQEWTQQTIEVLCTTPVSAAGILYGKFAAALSQVLAVALALLPITGVLYFVSRLPREVALGSFAIIVGTALLLGSVGLLGASLFRARQGVSTGALLLLGLLWAVVALLDAKVWVGHPLLEAAIPPRALYLVLQGRAPGGLTAGGFALLSLGVLVSGSVGTLAVTPWLFSRTFARWMASAVRPRPLKGIRRLWRCPRPPLGANEHPLAWQEKGSATRLLRWAVWAIYGVTAAVSLVVGLGTGSLGFFRDASFYTMLAVEGLVVLVLGSAFYGAHTFAREKSQRTAQALLLTGRSPRDFFLAKLRALYWALRYSLVAVVVAILASWYTSPARGPGGDTFQYVSMLETALLGPAAAAIVGMVFSAAATTPRRAVGALLLSWLWWIVLATPLSLAWTLWAFVPFSAWRVFIVPLAVSTAALAALLKLTRRWKPWRLSLLLALSFIIYSNATTAASVSISMGTAAGLANALVPFAVAHGVAAPLLLVWWRLGLRTFDAGMAQEPNLAPGVART